MIYDCFAASRPGEYAVMQRQMNSQVYQGTQQDNVRVAVCKLELRPSWMVQQDKVKPLHNRFRSSSFRSILFMFGLLFLRMVDLKTKNLLMHMGLIGVLLESV